MRLIAISILAIVLSSCQMTMQLSWYKLQVTNNSQADMMVKASGISDPIIVHANTSEDPKTGNFIETFYSYRSSPDNVISISVHDDSRSWPSASAVVKNGDTIVFTINDDTSYDIFVHGFVLTIR